MRVAVGILVVLAAVTAAAERRPRLAVLELAIEGDAPPELRAQLGRSLVAGFGQSGYDVVTRDDVAARLRSAPALVGCVSTTCLERLGGLLGARRFVRARVEAAGAAYTVELVLLGAEVQGGVVQRLEKACPVCTLVEVNDLVTRTAVELMAPRPARSVIQVQIESRPDGATVSCDGTPLGRAPVEAALEPGEHLFAASLPGRQHPVELRQLISAEAARVVLAFDAVAATGETVPVPTSRFAVWKWLAVGGAAVALVTGVTLLAVDGQETDCAPGAACRSIYSTGTGGAILVGAGAALGAAAVYLFLGDRVETRIAPTVGGLQVGARVRF